MSTLAERDLSDLFESVLDSAALAVGDGEDAADDDSLLELRELLAALGERAGEASTPELLDAAGLSVGDGEDGRSLATVFQTADAEDLDSLRTLLDLAELGEDAPDDDDAFLDRLGGVVGDDVDDADDTATGADAEGADDDLLPTVADVFSGTSSFVLDWFESRNGDVDAEETAEAGESGAEEAEDEEEAEDDDLIDTDDLLPDSDGDQRDAATGQGGRNTRRRFSSVPSSRSSLGRAGRFSSIKGRTRR